MPNIKTFYKKHHKAILVTAGLATITALAAVALSTVKIDVTLTEEEWAEMLGHAQAMDAIVANATYHALNP